MESLDILVQPSLRETFGRVLIEAMASRKPAVVTRVGGMPEIVVNGETGLVVPPENPPALAAAVVSLLQDRARSQAMGEAGRRRVEEHFTLPERIRRLESIYSDVIRQQL
jgi:glycosyltransferase involved in cell wall biosynthesis